MATIQTPQHPGNQKPATTIAKKYFYGYAPTRIAPADSSSLANPAISKSKSSNPLNPSSTTHFWPPALCKTSQLQPTTSKPGGLLPSSSIAAQTCCSVDRTTRWSGQEARSMTAQGVSRGQGNLLGLSTSGVVMVSESTSELSRCNAMRNTTV